MYIKVVFLFFVDGRVVVRVYVVREKVLGSSLGKFCIVVIYLENISL